jgi:hypothetical protein
LADQWKESIIVSIYKKGDNTGIIVIIGYLSYQLRISFSQG